MPTYRGINSDALRYSIQTASDVTDAAAAALVTISQAVTNSQNSMMFERTDGLPEPIRERYDQLLTLHECRSTRTSTDAIANANEALSDGSNYSGSTTEMEFYLDYLISRVQMENAQVNNVREKSNDEAFLANRRDGRSRLIAPMGFEYAYHPPRRICKGLTIGTDFVAHEQDRLVLSGEPLNQARVQVLRRNRRTRHTTLDQVKDFMYNHGIIRKKQFGHRIYQDGDCIEVCSPVHRSFASIREWFGKVHPAMRLMKMSTWSRKSGGGGMHVNISYNKDLPNWKLAYANFFMMVANHPEINWMFNEPSDNHTARCLASDNRFMEVVHKLKQRGWQWDDSLWPSLEVCGGKSVAINGKDEYHFELRTFRMVRDVSELMDVVEFVNSLLAACAEIASWGVLVPWELELPTSYCSEAEDRGYPMPDDSYLLVYDERMWTADSEFYTLLRDIGLDPAKYRKYAKRNYMSRRAHPYGKKYMT